MMMVCLNKHVFQVTMVYLVRCFNDNRF